MLYVITHILVVFQNTLLIHGLVLWHLPVTTDDFIIKTGHNRRLYTRFTQLCKVPHQYTNNTRSCIITYTGHDRRLNNQNRSRPTTLYTFYTIMQSSSEYTKNTRSCIITYTGHDRRLYKRLTQLSGLRSTGVGIWYYDPGRALPTVRIIVPSSPMVSVWPNTTAHSMPEQYMVVWHSLVERDTINSYLADYTSPTWNTLHNNTNSSGFLHIHTRKVLLPHSKHYN